MLNTIEFLNEDVVLGSYSSATLSPVFTCYDIDGDEMREIKFTIVNNECCIVDVKRYKIENIEKLNPKAKIKSTPYESNNEEISNSPKADIDYLKELLNLKSYENLKVTL